MGIKMQEKNLMVLGKATTGQRELVIVLLKHEVSHAACQLSSEVVHFCVLDDFFFFLSSVV